MATIVFIIVIILVLGPILYWIVRGLTRTTLRR
jgi:hypothetical protein